MGEVICHECGGHMARDIKPLRLEYKGRDITVDQPGWYCLSCGESILTGTDMAATEPAFLEFKAEVDGYHRDETRHLASSPQNAARINDAIAEVDAGNAVEIDF